MKSFSILVIDDASMIRDLIKKFVRDYFPGAKLFDANNGQSGKSVLLHQEIDMILCDWEMPEMDGMELLQWVRSEERYKNKPFIMVTSRGDKEFVMEAVKAGVSDYLVKPFNRQQFAEKVQRALKRHNIQGRMAMPEKAASSSLEVLTGGKSAAPTKPKPTLTKSLPKGVALVRTSNGDMKCAVKNIDTEQCIGVFKIAGYIPTILDTVSLDIEFDAGEKKQIMRINGFISCLQASERKPDSHLIQVTIVFMDEDPKKHQLIKDYLAQFN